MKAKILGMFFGRQPRRQRQEGAALIVALWVLLTLSLLIGAFAYDMHIEAGIASYYRKRFKAQYLARAGVEYAKLLLAKSMHDPQNAIAKDKNDEDFLLNAIRFSRGAAIKGMSRDLGEGSFTIDLVEEEGRRNVNKLTDEDWEELLDQANVPEDKWTELIDCFADWVDTKAIPGTHRMNGAGSDDPFYVERGYQCHQAPLDTVDELCLIKNFDNKIVYGGPPDKVGGKPYLGIAQWLTVWGDGKVNINIASKEVLLTLPGMDETMVNQLLQYRNGADQIAGTKDDGFDSIDQAMAIAGLPESLKDKITTTDKRYLRIKSIGEVDKVRSGIWCIMQVTDDKMTPVFWREEDMP